MPRLRDSSVLKRRSVRYYKLVLSYLLILILIIAVGFPIITEKYLESIRQKEESRQQAMLQNAAALLDQRFSELHGIAISMGANSRLSYQNLHGAPIAQMAAIDTLRSYIYPTSLFSDVMLFSGNDAGGVVITSEYKYDMDTYFRLVTHSNWNKDDVLSLFNQRVFGKALPLSKCTHSIYIQETNNLYLFYSLASSSTTFKCLACFEIPEKNLISMAQIALGNEGLFEITDGETVYYTSGKLPEGKALTCTVPSQTMLWNYTATVPATIVAAQLVQAQHTLTVSAVLLLALGTALAYVMANRHYKPLRQLVTKLHTPDGTDEFQALSVGVDSILQSNNMLASQLQEQNKRLMHEKMLSLLLGADEHAAAFTESLHPYSVLLLNVDHLEAWNQRYTAAERQAVMASLCERMEALARERGNGYAVQMPEGNSIALLSDMQDEKLLLELAYAIHSEVSTVYPFSITIGVSETGSEPANVHVRYLQARAAVWQRLSRGGGQVITYRDTQENTSAPIAYTSEKEHMLLGMVRQGKADEASALVRETLDKQKENASSADEMLLCTVGILSSLVRLQKEMGVRLDEKQGQVIRILRSELTITFEQAQEWMCRLAEELCSEVLTRKNSTRNERMRLILALIDERYQDPSFCLNDVATELGLSASYTTTLFKECQGETLMSYVDGVRMLKAIHLLETTDISVRDVVMQVGYTDQTNFTRKFKALKNVTPALYRQQVRQHQET